MLHLSPYLKFDSASSRPNKHPSPPIPDNISPFDNDTINNLFSNVTDRYEQLLSGTLETGSTEPPVCRYINAMIALGSHAGKPADEPLKIWLEILDKINALWSSNIPHRSMSGRNFAGVLIAEMDVIKLVIDLLSPISTSNNATPGNGNLESEPVGLTSSPGHNYMGQHAIQIPSTSVQVDKVERLLRLNTRLTSWLNVAFTLLDLHAKGQVVIDGYLVGALFRAISDGASCLKTTYRTLCEYHQTPLTPEDREKALNSLFIAAFLLLESAKSSQPAPRMELLKAYSNMLPIVLHYQKQLTWNEYDHMFNFCDLRTAPPTVHHKIRATCVRVMMVSAGYLCYLLPELTQYQWLLEYTLNIVYYLQGNDYLPGHTLEVFRHHIGDYARILEFAGTSPANLELVSESMASDLAIFAINSPSSHLPSNGCFLSLNSAQIFLQFILDRLKSSSVSITQLPPQTFPLTETRPSMEYLHRITRFPGGFSAFVKAGTTRADPDHSQAQGKAEIHGVAKLTIIAANHDSDLEVNPVELGALVVPEFLDAAAWTLQYLTPEEDGDLYDRFIVAASVLLVVASEDSESREKVAEHSVRMTLLQELSKRKNVCFGIISMEEWGRLAHGLDLGKARVDEESATSRKLDEEPGKQPEEKSGKGLKGEPEKDVASNTTEVVGGKLDSNDGVENTELNAPQGQLEADPTLAEKAPSST